MQSLGSTSSWLSRDSLSSGHSLLFSESEQTEDEADVFLSEGEGEGAEGVELGRASGVGLRSRSARGIVRDQAGPWRKTTEGQTEGDCVFAQKCAELQVFVRPLLELLNGLKKGRYTRGLSSFQQSIAMDRIQRIVGVLQKPSMGEKYLQTLLQVEMLLKLWFPQISPCAPPATAPPHHLPLNAAHRTPPRWHRDQLHIPVKKRRLSWTETDCLSPPPGCKHLQQEQQEEVHVGLEERAASPLLETSEGTELDGGPTGSYDRGAFWEKESEETQEMFYQEGQKEKLFPACYSPNLH
ncbi:circadian associated repressor of transcription a [Megalops cyprinoides]|uniref:circadian associated repressor of transcription a n=1 Tax=Megalops cyprinoides TaxID=118141 RepID=UPI0018646F88|nr:circadian associated repressor of transcription a [Megalops cyprinoides]